MNEQNIKVFVGCDPNNCDLEQMMVLDYSIQKHTSIPVDIIWMQLSRDASSFWYTDTQRKQGWRTEKWATPFSGFRWAIPSYCGYEGRAIYMDTDVIVLSDLYELWTHPIEGNAIVAAKGDKSTARLCTCVWDCEKAKTILPNIELVKNDPDSHKNLMKMIKEHPGYVEPYQDHYNCIDGEALDLSEIKILHYSDMGTQFSHKYALPRLKQNHAEHWFDGEIFEHPRQDLATLFDQYYQEAINAGFKLEDYMIEPYGPFYKASQKNYHGNRVTRDIKEKSWFKQLIRKMKPRTQNFILDD
ncbi:glycosyl transferase [Acinetobacter sp. 194]|uniref:glycosyltransferase n=1 Tax=Acinetobacter shaoyimingii TaxID=2715164 RepID=UPI00140D299E|nr:glycosyltransferase [Acinetobacter shaoyimingii]NHB58716.1 glycosyl transferase [Acinetobacter shaoyimingii]